MINKMSSISLIIIIILSTIPICHSKQSDDAEAPDNFREVGNSGILVRHAFPADGYRYNGKDMRSPFRADVVDDEMLQFLKNSKVTIIFDVANLWTKREIQNARKKFGIDVTKKINLQHEEYTKVLKDENIKFFLDKIEAAKKNGSKVSVHCRAGIHRAGVMSAVYLIEKEGYSNEEAINYWKTNALPLEFERSLKIIGIVEKWDDDKINSVKRKVIALRFKNDNKETKFLRNYKK